MTNSPLDVWYAKFAGKTNDELTVGDIATAIRQNVEIDRILPLAIEMFKVDHLSGEKYDGELFFSLLEVNIDYWKKFPEIFSALQSYAGEVLETEDLNGKLVVDTWLEKVGKRKDQKSNI